MVRKHVRQVATNNNAVNISRDVGGVFIIPFIVDFNRMERHFPRDMVVVLEGSRIVGLISVDEGHGSA